HDRKEQSIHASRRPVPRTPLRISINEEHLVSLEGKPRGDVHRKRCFPYPTLLVEHGDNHARPHTEARVSVKTYFCISVQCRCQIQNGVWGSESKGSTFCFFTLGTPNCSPNTLILQSLFSSVSYTLCSTS